MCSRLKRTLRRYPSESNGRELKVVRDTRNPPVEINIADHLISSALWLLHRKSYAPLVHSTFQLATADTHSAKAGQRFLRYITHCPPSE